ncbi:MAG: hypothetical protein ABMA01_06165 [Chthoniobacteraceae bacterium]
MHRIIASALLMAYMATGTPVIPASVAMLAALDGSHSVAIQGSEHGTQLVLRHQPGGYTPEIQDHTSPLARVLVAFCRPDVQRDHMLSTAQISSSATPVRGDAKSEIQNASSAELQVPAQILTVELWCGRDMIRVPVPATSSRDVARRQHSRVLATVQLLV